MHGPASPAAAQNLQNPLACPPQVASLFNDLSTLPGPVAAQDSALHATFAQALADSALLEHTCKAALRLAQLWDPATSNCTLGAAAGAVPAATAPAASGRSSSGQGGTAGYAGASSGGDFVARLRTEALQACGPSEGLFRAAMQAQPGPLLPQEQGLQAMLWCQTALLLLRLEEVRPA